MLCLRFFFLFFSTFFLTSAANHRKWIQKLPSFIFHPFFNLYFIFFFDICLFMALPRWRFGPFAACYDLCHGDLRMHMWLRFYFQYIHVPTRAHTRARCNTRLLVVAYLMCVASFLVLLSFRCCSVPFFVFIVHSWICVTCCIIFRCFVCMCCVYLFIV